MLQMKQSCVSNRRKAIKKGDFCLIEKLYKKIDFYLRADNLKTISCFFLFFSSHLMTSYFTNPDSVHDKLNLESNDAQ